VCAVQDVKDSVFVCCPECCMSISACMCVCMCCYVGSARCAARGTAVYDVAVGGRGN